MAVRAADRQPQVLVLHSTRRDAAFSILADRELPRLLDGGRGLDYYSEYIDLPRFSDPEYQTSFRHFLERKYAGQRFDVIVAMFDSAIEFLRTYRDELFPGTPVVFLANREPVSMPNATGVVAESRFQDTVAFAAELQPDLLHVYVVTGASSRDKEYEAETRAQFERAKLPLTFTYLAGLSSSELESKLRTLPARSMVYMVVFYQDAAGKNFHPLEFTDRVSAVASAPTYSWLDSLMDHGIVGGSVLSEKAEIDAVAGVGLRVLNGEHAGAIATSSPDLRVRQIDWRQLRRWGISEARVPPGSLVRFREPDVWSRYKSYIIAASALVVGQSFLIGGLLLQRRRRRYAEEKNRDLGGRLLVAHEEERARIARELHDDVSQQIAVLALDLTRMRRAESNDGESVEQAIDRVQAIASSLHNLSHRLHPARLQMLGLVPALDGLQHETSRPGFVVEFWHDDVDAGISAELALCLFRVAQEALQNALKYSKAHRVSMRLTCEGNRLELTIVDDGVGFDVDKASGRGLGLVSMHERLELVGGTVTIRSRPGAGTSVGCAVPLRFAADSPARAGGVADHHDENGHGRGDGEKRRDEQHERHQDVHVRFSSGV